MKIKLPNGDNIAAVILLNGGVGILCMFLTLGSGAEQDELKRNLLAGLIDRFWIFFVWGSFCNAFIICINFIFRLLKIHSFSVAAAINFVLFSTGVTIACCLVGTAIFFF